MTNYERITLVAPRHSGFGLLSGFTIRISDFAVCFSVRASAEFRVEQLFQFFQPLLQLRDLRFLLFELLVQSLNRRQSHAAFIDRGNMFVVGTEREGGLE